MVSESDPSCARRGRWPGGPWSKRCGERLLGLRALGFRV